jgi:hypothetical protein
MAMTQSIVRGTCSCVTRSAMDEIEGLVCDRSLAYNGTDSLEDLEASSEKSYVRSKVLKKMHWWRDVKTGSNSPS